MKYFILKLVRKYLHQREFRVALCREIMNNHLNDFNEQTIPGRYAEACGEWFEGASDLVRDDFYRNITIDSYNDTQNYIADNPHKFPENLNLKK